MAPGLSWLAARDYVLAAGAGKFAILPRSSVDGVPISAVPVDVGGALSVYVTGFTGIVFTEATASTRFAVIVADADTIALSPRLPIFGVCLISRSVRH